MFQTREYERAELWLSKMLKAGLQANVTSYSAVIDAFAKAGHVERAEQWLSTMHNAGIEADVVSYSVAID